MEVTAKHCPRCNSRLNWDYEDNCPWCLYCGYRPRITPLGKFYADRELVPTGMIYKQRAGSKVPPTRMYE